MSNTKCRSSMSLKAELEASRRKLSLRGTWHTMEQGITQLADCCHNGGCEFPTEMLVGIHSLSKPLNHAISSDRNSLSCSAIELLNALSAGLGPSFAPLIPLFIPSLLALCARTSKAFTKPAQACTLAIIRRTKSQSILPLLAESLGHKSASVRSVAAEGVLAYLTCLTPPETINDARARLLEDVIELTARDASASVRHAGKMIFEAYKSLLPDRLESFTALLTPITKKYLGVQGSAVSQPTSQVLLRGHPTTSLRVQKTTSGKLSDTRACPLVLKRAQDVHATKPTVESNPATSARQDTLRPSEPCFIQVTNKPEVACGPVFVTPRPQQVHSMKLRNDEPRVRIGTRRVPAPLPETSSTGRMSFVKAVHPMTRRSQLGSHGLSPKEVQQQASLYTSRRKVMASRSGQQAGSQKNPVCGGGPGSKTPKAITEARLIGVAKLGSITCKPTVSGEPPARATTPHVTYVSGDVSSLSFDTTASSYSINTPDSKVPFSSIQDGYMNTPSHMRRDATGPTDRTRRAPRRLHRVSVCTERSLTSTPPSCNRPMRPLLACIQRSLPLSSSTHKVIVSPDASHSPRTDVDPQGENLYRARTATFAVFKDPVLEVMSSDATAVDPPSPKGDSLQVASQFSSSRPNATAALHSDGLQGIVQPPLVPLSTTAALRPRRQRTPRLVHRGRRPSDFKFLPVLPMSPIGEAAPISVTTANHIREVADFLDIAIEEYMF